MSWSGIIPLVFGIGGLVVAYKIYEMLIAYPEGEGELKAIGDSIHSGAMVFMQREYKMLGIFAGVLVILLIISPLGFGTAFSLSLIHI